MHFEELTLVSFTCKKIYVFSELNLFTVSFLTSVEIYCSYWWTGELQLLVMFLQMFTRKVFELQNVFREVLIHIGCRWMSNYVFSVTLDNSADFLI